MPRRGGGPDIPLADRITRGRAAQRAGVEAEGLCCAALEAEGWRILARRLRTPAGELDLVADREGLLAFIEVKQRPVLADAAAALTTRQMARLIAAADSVLAERPDWGAAGVRFDVMLVDAAGRVRRVRDAFRAEG